MSLFDPSEGRTHLLRSPIPVHYVVGLIGSQDGWFSFVDTHYNIFLVNPIALTHIPLPPIASLPLIQRAFFPGGSVASMYAGHQVCSTCGTDHPKLQVPHPVGKLAFSPDFKSFVATSGTIPFLIYSRRGDTSWKVLDALAHDCFTDIIFSRSGRFLALSSRSKIFTYDLSCDPPSRTVIVPASTPEQHYWYYSYKYLVEDEDEDEDPLMICMDPFLRVDRNGKFCEPFVAARLQGDGWRPVKSLGGRSAFVGTCRPYLWWPGDVPGLKANCIYTGYDIYNVEDGTQQFVGDDGGRRWIQSVLSHVWIKLYPPYYQRAAEVKDIT